MLFLLGSPGYSPPLLDACHSRTSFASVYARCAEPDRSWPEQPGVRSSPTSQDSSRRRGDLSPAGDDPGSQTGEHGRPMSRLNAPCDSFLMGCPSNRHATVSIAATAGGRATLGRRQLDHSSRVVVRSASDAQNSDRLVRRPRCCNSCLPFRCQNRPVSPSLRRQYVLPSPRKLYVCFGLFLVGWLVGLFVCLF